MNAVAAVSADEPGAWRSALQECAARLRDPSLEDDRDDLLHEAAILMDGMAITSFRDLDLKLGYEIEIEDYNEALKFAFSTRRFRNPTSSKKQPDYLRVFLQKFVEQHRAVGDMMLDPPRDALGALTLPSGEMLRGFFVRPRAHFFAKENSTERSRVAK